MIVVFLQHKKVTKYGFFKQLEVLPNKLMDFMWESFSSNNNFYKN